MLDSYWAESQSCHKCDSFEPLQGAPATYQVVFYDFEGHAKQAVEITHHDERAVRDRVRSLHYADAVEVYREGRFLERIDGKLLAIDR